MASERLGYSDPGPVIRKSNSLLVGERVIKTTHPQVFPVPLVTARVPRAAPPRISLQSNACHSFLHSSSLVQLRPLSSLLLSRAAG